MKTIRVRHGKSRVVAFTNGFVTYGKNLQNKYRIELKPDFGLLELEPLPIYQSKLKPWIRNLRFYTWVLIPFAPFTLLFILIAAIVITYFFGARNFIRNTAWVDCVREFNWINFILVIVLTALLIWRW